MKARLKFSKTGSMKFIGHLDLMRYFQKAFRRSGFPVAYSEGFSPHPLMSFASPLGVGLTSDGEYLDVRLERDPEPDGLLERLNRQMNDEIRITAFTPLPGTAKPSMSLVTAADYMVSRKDGYEHAENWEVFSERFADFMALESIPVMKETKRSCQETDIRPLILSWSLQEEAFRTQGGSLPENSAAQRYQNNCRLFLKLAAGSVNHLKPDLVLKAYYQRTGREYNSYGWQYHRLELYGTGPEGRTLPLSGLTEGGYGE